MRGWKTSLFSALAVCGIAVAGCEEGAGSVATPTAANNTAKGTTDKGTTDKGTADTPNTAGTNTADAQQDGAQKDGATSDQKSDQMTAFQQEAQAFLDEYTKEWLRLDTIHSEAEWTMETHIVEGDDTAANAAEEAAKKLAAYVGSVAVIEKSRELLQRKDELQPLQTKQLEQVLYKAADKPQTIPDVVDERIAAETKQVGDLYGFKFMLDGQEVDTGEIDRILTDETDLAKRQAAWESSKMVGPTLKPGLEKLRDLRNKTVQALDYPDYFAYQVSDYGMNVDEMLEMTRQFNRDLRPLYRELHTYVRYELAQRYGQPVPDALPAHWLPNRWGQSWQPAFPVEGVDLTAALKDKEPEWLVKQAERFYVSLGFPSLPQSFWEKSSLYPVKPDAGFKKNNHASAWHVDLDHDVRCLMSVEPTTDYYNTTHHELGHIYYYLAYSTPQVPPLLREGANRAFHEAIGSQMGMAAMQPKFVKEVGLNVGAAPDPIQAMLYEAMELVVFIPFSTGVMTEFEHKLYAENLPPDQWNKTWWDLVGKYQGIAPPSPRGEEFCDAATKTHINDDAAQYYDYAISYILLVQMHDHVAREILHEDPHDTNYYGRKEVGDFLRGVLEPGATGDWRKLVRESTGGDLSANTMVDYFEPLMTWLQEQNKGRTHTLPELE